MRTLSTRPAGFLAVLAVLVVLVVGFAPSTVTAKGGWATVSYDPLPELVVGASVDVSFRVLQHGVSPLTPETWTTAELDAIRLDVTGRDSTIEVPTAVDAEGRFTASFTVPAANVSVALAVVWNDGLFLQQEPIAVPVAPAPDASTWPGWLPYGFGTLALAGVALVAADVHARRRARLAARPDPDTDLVPA